MPTLGCRTLRPTGLALFTLALFSSSLAGASRADDDLAKVLRAKDQALLDALAPGDRAPWERALAPGAVYIDENGVVMNRDAYLESLVPLPPGATGHLSIVDYSLRRFGGVALVIHRDAEREMFHGVPLEASYLTSETWLNTSGEWRLAMVHAYVVAVDPPSVTLSTAALDAYVGTYQAGTDMTFVILRQGNNLLAGRAGGPMKPLLAEASDVLFTPGQPRIKRLFHRDERGRVTGFVDRREGEDIVWRKAVTP